MSDAHRLPDHVEPLEYRIHLQARLGQESFDGKVTVDLDIQEATDRIVLHAKRLAIDEAVVDWPGAKGAGVAARTELDEEAERLILELGEAVPEGQATLEITYRGEVRQDMAGLYLSEDGDERCLVTQCEATDARSVFPCFDEPGFKAKLQWTITTDPMHHVLANGSLLDRRVDQEQGLATWEFEATPPIASYLAAVAIGNFAACKEQEARGTPFKVWALGGKEAHGSHANRFATKLLPWFADYFDVAYPYSKYDQVAVPSFSFGAMENVGLVVFRSSLLLMDESTTAWRQLKAIDRVVAHEFAHMWFGNLVTMAWWDDLWLNEAFAEWIAHKVVDDLEPEHKVWFEFQGRTSQAMDTDALASTHPIYNPVDTPEEAMEMFDAITYGKGSSVMRMLEAFLTPEAFRAGLRTYMEAFGEGNARGQDLWDHLGQASDQPVDAIAKSWIEQGGHPVVSLSAQPTETGLTLTLSQTRFRTSAYTEVDGTTWQVPMVLTYEDEAGVHEHRHLLTEPQDTLRLATEGEVRWLYGNAGDVGFYRVDHSRSLLDDLIGSYQTLAPAERIGLLRDQWDLVRAGDQTLEVFLGLLEQAAETEDHFAVVEHLVGHIRDLERMVETLGDQKALGGLRAWTRQTLSSQLEAVGLEPGAQEDPATGQLRAALVKAVGGIGCDGETLVAARSLAQQERQAPAMVDPDLAQVAIRLEAMDGGEATFDEHLSTYESRKASQAPPQETQRYLTSLPAFRKGRLVDRTLETLLDGTVPKQSVGPLMEGMLAQPHSQEATFEAIETNWDWITGNLGGAWVARLVEASGQMPPARGEEVITFYEEHLDGLAQQALGRAKERLEARAELHERIGKELAAWCQDHA